MYFFYGKKLYLLGYCQLHAAPVAVPDDAGIMLEALVLGIGQDVIREMVVLVDEELHRIL